MWKAVAHRSRMHALSDSGQTSLANSYVRVFSSIDFEHRIQRATELITLRTSEVAVYCSSDKAVLRAAHSNSRVFSIAITGLIGEGFYQFDLLIGEGIGTSLR